jgi:hypothetical protein
LELRTRSRIVFLRLLVAAAVEEEEEEEVGV